VIDDSLTRARDRKIKKSVMVGEFTSRFAKCSKDFARWSMNIENELKSQEKIKNMKKY
jgi:hypothetical protein